MFLVLTILPWNNWQTHHCWTTKTPVSECRALIEEAITKPLTVGYGFVSLTGGKVWRTLMSNVYESG